MSHCFADMKCVYWIELYLNIFKNRFKLDNEELKHRLSVPKEIQKQGSKAVADFLKSQIVI
jgi:hypothetical protein